MNSGANSSRYLNRCKRLFMTIFHANDLGAQWAGTMTFFGALQILKFLRRPDGRAPPYKYFSALTLLSLWFLDFSHDI